MPPLVIHALVPLSTHSSLASSYTARVRSEETSEPASGSRHAERAELDVVGGAEALRHPLHDLLGRAVAGDAGGGEARAEDGQADAGVTPEQLLERDRQRQAGGVADRGLGEEVEGVEADLGRLLDDRPRELLPLVPLVGGRADDLLGEVVDPLLDLLLIFVQVQGELSHPTCPWSCGDPMSYRSVTKTTNPPPGVETGGTAPTGKRQQLHR